MKTLDKPITLRDILDLLKSDSLPDTWKAWDDVRPQTSYKVELAFMAEDETHVITYAENPIMIPWYGCKVTGIDPQEDGTLRIWLDYENFLKHHKEWLRWKDEDA